MKRVRYGSALVALVVAGAGCGGASGSAGSAGGASLDAGPPPRALFYAPEGLKWGMTPIAVKAAWGPGDDGEANAYANKGGYPRVSLGYLSIPPGAVFEADVEPAARTGGPVLFLTWMRLEGGPDFKKESARADLLSRFGPPLTDAKLLRAHDCQPPRCELFRAAECTVARASWKEASAEAGWPAHLDSLTYRLAPDSLVQYVPRTEWPRLRGAVPLSFTPETEARFGGVGRGGGATNPTTDTILRSLGSPNLYWETAPGKGTLAYLFLDGSFQTVKVDQGRYDGAMGSTVN